MTPESAKQFWDNLIAEDPKKALVIAKACPQLASAWMFPMPATVATGSCRYRLGVFPFQPISSALSPLFCFTDRLFSASVLGDHLGQFTTIDEAKSACDAKLRELGYLLEDEE